MKPEYVFYVNVGRRSYAETKKHLDEIRDNMDEVFGEGRVLVLERSRGDSVIKVLNPHKSNRAWDLFSGVLSRMLATQNEKEGETNAESLQISSIAEVAFAATDIFELVEARKAKEYDPKTAPGAASNG